MTPMQPKKTKEFYNFLFIGIISFIMLFLTNFSIENLLYYAAKSALALSLVLFISGYSLISLIFSKELKTIEVFVISIGTSISITILAGMIIHFLSLEISFANIMNLVSIITLILAFFGFLRVVLKKVYLEVQNEI